MGRAYGKTLRSNLPSHFMNIAIALSTRYASNFGTAERDGLWTRRTLDDREDARYRWSRGAGEPFCGGRHGAGTADQSERQQGFLLQVRPSRPTPQD